MEWRDLLGSHVWPPEPRSRVKDPGTKVFSWLRTLSSRRLRSVTATSKRYAPAWCSMGTTAPGWSSTSETRVASLTKRIWRRAALRVFAGWALVLVAVPVVGELPQAVTFR